MDVKIILSILGALISLVAVVLIYNARKIVKERFAKFKIFFYENLYKGIRKSGIDVVGYKNVQ